MAQAVVIKNLVPQPRFIVVQEAGEEPATGFTVRGLRMDETIALLEDYQAPLAAFFGNQNLDFSMLVADAPDLCAKVIAFASNTVGQEEDIKDLPIQSQVEALMAVWEMSVPNVKKLLASLEKASSSLAVARANTPTP